MVGMITEMYIYIVLRQKSCALSRHHATSASYFVILSCTIQESCANMIIRSNKIQPNIVLLRTLLLAVEGKTEQNASSSWCSFFKKKSRATA